MSGWRFWDGPEVPDGAGFGAGRPLTEECAETDEGRGPLLDCELMGWLRLVDRLRISLPWTIMLSLDFLRSRVSISGRVSGVNPSLTVSWRGNAPSPPASKSMADPILTLMTPRKPWSFFLNFFWSNIWTARIESSVALLLALCQCPAKYEAVVATGAYMSKLSFQ